MSQQSSYFEARPQSFPRFEAAGSPQELGRQHGEQARGAIAAFLEYLAAGLKLSHEQLCRRATRFRPLFEKNCPRLLEEIDGLADGANISTAAALAVQLRGELGQLAGEACTTFVIGSTGTLSGETLIGQTSDMAGEIIDEAYVLHLKPDDGRPELIMWTFGGMIGYHGVNAEGVAHFANALGGGPSWRFALSHYPLKRLMLECREMDEVVRLTREFSVCSNGNYVLCDGDGRILDVEMTADGPEIIDDAGEGFIAHSNHYLCRAHACRANFDKSLPDSFPRLDRMRALIQSSFGSITVDLMQTFLSDHDNHPTSICRHPHAGYGDDILPNTGHTVAALIAEPSHGRLHVSRGNPCENLFQTYEMAGSR